jgi:membrane associated rhomboid family serine protease
MLPIADDNTTRTSIPVITYALIALNALFFVLEWLGGEAFIEQWAFVPGRFMANPGAGFLTVFTAMFMHAGPVHLAGNMLYLAIFGDNVEDRFGRVRFLVFYLSCGIAATLAQLAFRPASSVPTLGASGAIAGAMGAYVMMFPRQRVRVLLGLRMASLSALFVIGSWIVVQSFSGIATIASTADVGGVAYLAHVGGFAAGLLLTWLFLGSEGEGMMS